MRLASVVTVVISLSGCAAGAQYSHLEQRDRDLTQLVLELQKQLDDLLANQKHTHRSVQQLQRATEKEIAGIRRKTDQFDVVSDGQSFMLVPAD